MALARKGDTIDADKLGQMARTVFGALGGAMTSAMIYLGDRLGLYRALAEVDTATSHELATATGLSERQLNSRSSPLPHASPPLSWIQARTWI